MDRVLRLLESIMFCCLSALVLFWLADRMRGAAFDPMPVVPCAAGTCLPYVGPDAGRLSSIFAQALEPRGVVSFSTLNLCARVAETLQTRGIDADGIDTVLDQMSQRGTITLLRPEAGPLVIGPGARNDGVLDVFRDAVTFGPARGCYPINYKPVFWPLWLGWIVLVLLRLFRGRQREWATR